jgi:Bacterial PH domain
MSTLIEPYKDDITNNRPGVELFVWRVAVSFIFLVLSILLFTLQLDSMSFIKKTVTLSCILVLSLIIFYHLYLIIFFKKLCYDITADCLTIRSFMLHDEIKFSDINEMTSLANETLVLKKKNLFSYFREAPQIVYPVAQFGTCTLEKFGAVRFYSFVDTFKEPKNLLFIRVAKNRQYAISPILADEFINLINQARKYSTSASIATRQKAVGS